MASSARVQPSDNPPARQEGRRPPDVVAARRAFWAVAIALACQAGVIGIWVFDGAYHSLLSRTLLGLSVASLTGAAAVSVALYLRNLLETRIERAHFIEMQELARRDELSGLYNIRYLRERLHAEAAEVARAGGTMALVLFDLNNFKDVNDRFGHIAGDALIASIGAALRHEVGDAGVAARQGGDEFAVLLPGLARERAEEIAVRAALAIARSSTMASPLNSNLAVTASYGVAVYPEDAGDIESLTAAADRALYRAKGEAIEALTRSEERHAQDVFFAIGQAIGRSLDPKEMVRNIVNAVGASLTLTSASIWLVRRDGSLGIRAYYADKERLPESFRIVQRDDPMKRDEAIDLGFLRGDAAYIDDVREASILPARFREQIDAGTWMISVPLASREGMLVLSGLHTKAEPPSMTLATAIGRVAGSALANADVYQTARRRGEQLSALAGLAGLLFSDAEFEEKLGDVVRRIVEVTGFDMVTIDAADPTEERPFFRNFYGRGADGGEYDSASADLWRSLRPALTEPSIVSFLESVDEPIVLDDPASQVPETYREFVALSGTKTVVVQPVKWQSEVKGLMYFASYRSQAFDDNDIALMHTIASQLGPALKVAQLHVELEHSYADLKAAHLQALLRLAYAAEARDPYTECHLGRIRAISQAIGKRMGMEADEREALGYGAIVHDLGKLRIPDSILINPGRLSDDEWREMKRHPEWGAEIIGENPFYAVAREVALNHHERWDGSGYPSGKQGEEIPLAARIVSVADVYDALTSARPYKAAWPVERALVELVRMRGKTLCPRSVDVFMELWRDGEIARIDDETEDESLEFDFRELFAA